MVNRLPDHPSTNATSFSDLLSSSTAFFFRRKLAQMAPKWELVILHVNVLDVLLSNDNFNWNLCCLTVLSGAQGNAISCSTKHRNVSFVLPGMFSTNLPYPLSSAKAEGILILLLDVKLSIHSCQHVSKKTWSVFNKFWLCQQIIWLSTCTYFPYLVIIIMIQQLSQAPQLSFLQICQPWNLSDCSFFV